jgi:hypothetical protein
MRLAHSVVAWRAHASRIRFSFPVHARAFSSSSTVTAANAGGPPKKGKKEIPLRTLLRQNLLESSNLKIFISHLWPKESNLKSRTAIAVALLVAGKVVNVQVPYMFKMAIDALSVTSTEAVLIVPTALFVGYGLLHGACVWKSFLIRFCLLFAGAGLRLVGLLWLLTPGKLVSDLPCSTSCGVPPLPS